MTLKTATLLAMIGTGIKVTWSLAMGIKSLQVGTAPALYRLAILPTLLFEVALFVFFLVLFTKQKADGDVQ
jgi:hypothetical protein